MDRKILHISNLQCGPNKKRKRGKLGKLGNLGKLPQTQNMWPGTHGRQTQYCLLVYRVGATIQNISYCNNLFLIAII